jgi:hypothetical protein
MTERSNHNDGPYTIILDKTTKEAYSADAAIRKSQFSQQRHGEPPEVHRLERRAYKDVATVNCSIVPLVLFKKGNYINKLHEGF